MGICNSIYIEACDQDPEKLDGVQSLAFNYVPKEDAVVPFEDTLDTSRSVDVVAYSVAGTGDNTLSSRRPLLNKGNAVEWWNVLDLSRFDPDEFKDAVLQINLKKVDAGQEIGVCTHACRGSHRISHIHKGSLLERFNIDNPDTAVEVGDHIVDVNSVRGDEHKIKMEWTTQPNLHMKIIAANTLQLDISKKANETLGIKTLSSSKVHQITSIETGLMMDWNDTLKHLHFSPVVVVVDDTRRSGSTGGTRLRVGDYIVEANRLQGDAEVIRQEWIASEKVTIKVMAPRRRTSAANIESARGDRVEKDG